MSGEKRKKAGVPAKAKEVQFEFSAAPGSHVFVAGTFNDWNPAMNPMKDNPDSGHYKVSLKLPPGRHEYRFIVDGVWSSDPNCPESVVNEFGAANSVIQV